MTAAVEASGVAGEIVALRALVDEAQTVEDCRRVRDALVPVLAVVEETRPPNKGVRHRSVRALAAAGVHLSRAGGPVPVEHACRLAAAELVEAVATLGGVR